MEAAAAFEAAFEVATAFAAAFEALVEEIGTEAAVIAGADLLATVEAFIAEETE
jgi:hypothetical protein